jgi:FkbM family methyltransferase
MLSPYLRFREKIRAWSDHSVIKAVCEEYKIQLGSPMGQGDAGVFKEVFLQKVYADYLPFYQACTILDIGAHKGFFTLFAALNIDPKSRLIALEPSLTNFTALEKNILANRLEARVRTWQCGLSDQSGSVDLFLGNSENHSLFKPLDGRKDAKKGSLTERVEMVALKELLERTNIDAVDFLKIDCEGAEYQALYSSDAETLKRIKTISMEFHDLKKPSATGLAMAEFLRGHGFTIVKFQHETTYKNLNTGKLIATRF